MGAHASKSVNETASMVSSTILNTAVTLNNTCQNSATTTQLQEYNVDGSGNLQAYNTCLTTAASAKWTDPATICSPLLGGAVTFNGISQGASVNITANCSILDTQTSTVQQDVMNAINAKLDNSTDDVGQFLTQLGSALGGSSNNTSSLKTSIANQVKATMTTTATNTMINAYATSQNLIFNVKSPPTAVAFQNVSQQLAVTALSSLVASNSVLNAAVQTAQNSVTTAATSTDQVLPGLWTTIQGGLAGWFGSIQNGEIAVAACVVCALCVLFGCSAVFFFSGGQSTLQQGISAASDAYKK